MAAFTENFDLGSLRQIYDIREVKLLAEFLLPNKLFASSTSGNGGNFGGGGLG